MSRELATVHVQYIPAGTYVDRDDYDYLVINGAVYIAQHGTEYDTDDGENGYTADVIGIQVSPIGLQSFAYRDESSILLYLYNDCGFEEIYQETEVHQLIAAAAKLRKDDNPFVSFVVAFNCDVEPDTDNWTGYTHGEPYAELTHYCDAETLEWIAL